MNSFAWPDSDQGGLHAFLSLVVIQGPLLLPAFQWPMKTNSALGYVELFFLKGITMGVVGGTPLAVQWLRICLPMQGMQI